MSSFAYQTPPHGPFVHRQPLIIGQENVLLRLLSSLTLAGIYSRHFYDVCIWRMRMTSHARAHNLSNKILTCKDVIGQFVTQQKYFPAKKAAPCWALIFHYHRDGVHTSRHTATPRGPQACDANYRPWQRLRWTIVRELSSMATVATDDSSRTIVRQRDVTRLWAWPMTENKINIINR